MINRMALRTEIAFLTPSTNLNLDSTKTNILKKKEEEIMMVGLFLI